MLEQIKDEKEFLDLFVFVKLHGNNQVDLSELEKSVRRTIMFAFKSEDDVYIAKILEQFKKEFKNLDVEKFLYKFNLEARRTMTENWTKSVVKTFFNKSFRHKRIFIPYAQNFACLFKYIKSDTNNNYVLQVPHSSLAMLLREVTFGGCSHVSIMDCDLYDKGYNDSFDYIFTLPPLVGRLILKEYLTKDITGISFEVLANSLNKSGIMTIIIPARVILSGDKNMELRKYIENKFNILEISELPADRFTSIRLFAITIENAERQSNSVVLKEYQFADYKSLKLLQGRCITIPQRVLANSNIWTPSYFIEKDGLKDDNFSDIVRVKLSDHFDIYRGRSYDTVNPTYIPVKLLNVKDINPDIMDISNCEDFQIDVKASRELYLRQNDIVLPCRGNGGMKIGLITNVRDDCVPSQNIVVIRAKDEVVNPEYLKIFLESPVGLCLLNSIQRGECIKQLSHKDIAQLEVPAPEREIQDLVVQEFKKGKQEYYKVTSKALVKWNALKSDLYKTFY